MKDPKVSIIIPVYNGSNYLKDAIDSALGQTYRNIEVIVVNDGSTDGGKTEEIALSYGERIRYYGKSNGGVSSALNYGIANMSGDYFSWLSHDDLYAPDKIEASVALLKAHNGLDKKLVAYTGGCFVDAKGKRIGMMRKHFSEGRTYSGYEAAAISAQKGTLFGCCFLISRTVFEEVGLFDETLRYSQDALMWYRMFLAGYKIVSDNLPNVMCRIHGNQVSQLRKDLFTHDAYVIAMMLAEPLASADNTGALLFRYLKRLTKYPCKEAVNYLCLYAKDRGYLTVMRSIILNVYKVIGLFRYRIVTCVKKWLICARQ